MKILQMIEIVQFKKYVDSIKVPHTIQKFPFCISEQEKKAINVFSKCDLNQRLKENCFYLAYY